MICQKKSFRFFHCGIRYIIFPLVSIFYINLLRSQVQQAVVSNSTVIKTVSTSQFEEIIKKQNDPQIIDTRLPQEFAFNHLINAVNINETDKDYVEKIQRLDKNRPVFTYAIGNGRSAQLAKELAVKNFATVFVLDGGIGGWIGQGKPIYSSVKSSFTKKDLEDVINTNEWVLVDLHTRYCPGCRKLQPTVDSLSSENPALKITKIDVYDNPETGGSYHAQALPTLVLIHKGKIIWQKTGASIKKNEVEIELRKEQLK